MWDIRFSSWEYFIESEQNLMEDHFLKKILENYDIKIYITFIIFY